MASAAASAARIRGLTKRYGDRVALDDVDLELAPGELLGLLGLNGAGKTTLLRTLFGLVKADSGSMATVGHPQEVAAGQDRAAGREVSDRGQAPRGMQQRPRTP